MLRYDRPRYIALGLPSLLNAALVIYMLELKPEQWSDDIRNGFYWALVGVLGLFGIAAMIKRARDLGSSAWGILLGFLFAPPFMLLVALILAFIPSSPDADRLEPPPPNASLATWQTGLAILVVPWLAIWLFR